jgi:hypothetical protein
MKACKKCKSTNVVVREWVNVNNPTLPDLNHISTDDTWCMKCDNYTGLVDVPWPHDGVSKGELSHVIDKMTRMEIEIKNHDNGFSILMNGLPICQEESLAGAIGFVERLEEGGANG